MAVYSRTTVYFHQWCGFLERHRAYLFSTTVAEDHLTLSASVCSLFLLPIAAHKSDPAVCLNAALGLLRLSLKIFLEALPGTIPFPKTKPFLIGPFKTENLEVILATDRAHTSQIDVQDHASNCSYSVSNTNFKSLAPNRNFQSQDQVQMRTRSRSGVRSFSLFRCYLKIQSQIRLLFCPTSMSNLYLDQTQISSLTFKFPNSYSVISNVEYKFGLHLQSQNLYEVTRYKRTSTKWQDTRDSEIWNGKGAKNPELEPWIDAVDWIESSFRAFAFDAQSSHLFVPIDTIYNGCP